MRDVAGGGGGRLAPARYRMAATEQTHQLIAPGGGSSGSARGQGLQWLDGAGCDGTSAGSPRDGVPVPQASGRLLMRRHSRPSDR